MRKFLFLGIIFLFLFSACKKERTEAFLSFDGLSYAKTISPKYANKFHVDEYKSQISENSESFYLLSIDDSEKYLIVPENAEIPTDFPKNIILIQKPVEKAYLCASGAMSLWVALNSLEKIRFSSIKQGDWFVEEAKNAMNSGKILYAGKYNAPDFELLLDENCSLAVESTMIYHSPKIKEKLESLGIPVFVDKSSYEEDFIARLEWIKVYGFLLGKEKEAQKFFEKEIEKISSVQENLKKIDDRLGGNSKSQGQIENPRVAFFYISPSGAVITRGEEDYIAKMISTAGGIYIAPKLKIKSKNPSVTISFEQFYANCADADILIYNSSIDNSIFCADDLIQKNALFKDFKAVKCGNLWRSQKSLYQSTADVVDIFLDFHKIITSSDNENKNDPQTKFFKKL